MKLELLSKRDKHGNNLYRLTQNYLHWDGSVVQEGFVTNFGTIPRGLRWLVRPSELREAAVVHDYRVGEFGQAIPYLRMSRKRADRLLIKDLEKLGIPWFKRKLIWIALRCYAKLARKR
jgi:hypothetical protein